MTFAFFDRSISSALVLMTLASCNGFPSKDTTALRKLVGTRVLLLEPSGKGYSSHRFGKPKEFIPVKQPQPFAFTPDLSGSAYTHVEHVNGTQFFEIRAKLADRPYVSLIRVPVSSSHLPSWKLKWGSASGDVVAIKVGTSLFLRCLTGDQQPTMISEDVLDFDVSSGGLLVLAPSSRKGALQILQWNDGKLKQIQTVKVPRANEVLSLGHDRVLLYTRTREEHVSKHASIVNTRTGRVQPLVLSSSQYLVEIIPLRGMERLILDEWDGDERVDGTMLTKLYVWDLKTGRRMPLWSNYADELLHELPANVGRIECPLTMVTAETAQSAVGSHSF